MGRQTDNRISYIRKPMAEHGYLCLGLAGVGLLLCVAGMAFSVRSQGNTPVGALSMCFSSILFSVASLMYGWKSFMRGLPGMPDHWIAGKSLCGGRGLKV